MRYAVKATTEPHLLIESGSEPQPAQDEAIVRVETAAICGSDIHANDMIPEYAWVKNLLPLVLGHEISGTVLDYGNRTQARERGWPPVGSRVAIQAALSCETCAQCRAGNVELCGQRSRLGFERQGGLSTHIATPGHTLYRLEPHVSREAGALVEPLTIALRALKSLPSPVGTTVSVLGMGAIGLLVAELLKISGASEINIVGTSADQDLGTFELATSLGATPYLADGPLIVSQYSRSHLVVNAAGAKPAMRQAMLLARPKAVVAAVALGIGEVEFDIDNLVRKEISVKGVYGNRPVDWLDAVTLINSGQITGRGIISHWMKLEDVNAGFQLLRAAKARKICITPN